MSSPSRLTELDALRGVAVLMVLAYHYTTRLGELVPQAAWGDFALGNYGVHVFFVISGFVIFMTLERSERAADFVLARFSRLYPAYWAGVLLTSTALWLVAGPVEPPSLRQAVVNLTMLQGFIGIKPVDGVYWSLEVELLFYAIALAAYRGGMLRRAEPTLCAWLFLSALYSSPLWEFLALVPGAPLAARLLVLEFAPLFTIGMLFYRLYRGEGRPAWNYALIGAALALVVRMQPGMVALLIAATSAAMWTLGRGGLAWLRFAPLVFLGTISYPLYLVHQKIGHAVLIGLAEHGWSPMPRLAAAALVSLGLATAITFLVERPAMQEIRRRYRARQSPAATARAAAR